MSFFAKLAGHLGEKKGALRSVPPPLLRILGPLAWGRFEGEPLRVESKDNIVYGVGYLEGARHVALLAAQEFHLEGEEMLRRAHDHMKKKESDLF